MFNSLAANDLFLFISCLVTQINANANANANANQAGDYSRCGEVVVGSAYVKLCSGNTQMALSMFNEVQETAVAHKDDFLSQVRCGISWPRWRGPDGGQKYTAVGSFGFISPSRSVRN